MVQHQTCHNCGLSYRTDYYTCPKCNASNKKPCYYNVHTSQYVSLNDLDDDELRAQGRKKNPDALNNF